MRINTINNKHRGKEDVLQLKDDKKGKTVKNIHSHSVLKKHKSSRCVDRVSTDLFVGSNLDHLTAQRYPVTTLASNVALASKPVMSTCCCDVTVMVDIQSHRDSCNYCQHHSDHYNQHHPIIIITKTTNNKLHSDVFNLCSVRIKGILQHFGKSCILVH